MFEQKQFSASAANTRPSSVMPLNSLYELPDEATRKSELAKFLTAVLPDSAPISLTLIQEGKQPGCKTFAASEVASLYDMLTIGNLKGFDVYFTVNRVDVAFVVSDKKSPTNTDITAVHALIADFDDPDKLTLMDLRNLPLPPSLIVESSPGKYQAYWLVENAETIAVEEFTASQHLVNKTLAKYGADKSVKDLRRVMRLPGFHHVKAKNRPITADDPVSGRFVSRLREANSRRYSRDELIGFFGEPSVDDYKHLLSELTQAEINNYDLAELDDHSGDKGQERLASLVNACEYLITHRTVEGEAWGTGGTWETMTAAFARFVSAGELKEEAIENWDDLCQKSAGKYDEVENLKRLYSFAQGRYSGKKLTAATVFAIAEAVYWINPAKPKLECVLHHARQLSQQSESAEVEELINHSTKLPHFEQERVLKLIKDKTKTTMAALRSLLKTAKQRDMQAVYGFDTDDHRELADRVFDTIGRENLFYAQSSWWRWQKRGVWQRVCDLEEIKQQVQRVIPATLKGVTSNTVASVTSLLQSNAYRSGVQFDQITGSENSVNCLNGLLVLRGDSWHIEQHNREQYRTTQIPVAYDTDATAPQFEAFLESVFRDDEDKQEKKALVLELIGYTLMSHARYAHSVVATGGGSNGKSVLLDVIEALVGIDNTASISPDKLGGDFHMAQLQGKLLNRVGELSTGAVLADKEFKEVVAGETQTAQFKYRDHFSFKPFCTIWIATNHMPHVRDTTHAMERRVSILKFNRKFEGADRDVDICGKLKSELPGILNLALAAYVSVVERGGFTQPISSVTEVRQWLKESNQVACFIDEQCTTDDPQATAGKSDLYSAYQKWAAASGYRQFFTKRQFGRQMKQLRFDEGHNDDQYFWRGLQLKHQQGGDFDQPPAIT